MSQVRPLASRLQYFEEALHRTGWGLYYKFLVGFAACNAFSNGVAFLTVYLTLPQSACDTGLNQDDIVHVHISFTLGRIFGGFVLSSISDNFGKKCMIPKTLLLIFLSTFLAAFSHSSYLMYLANFFLGSGLQANLIINKIYLAEILPSHSRGFYLVVLDVFWTLGYFTSALMTYTTIETTVIEHQGVDMRLTSWRIVYAAAGGICIILACSSALLEMSPRFLLFKRRVITCILVLKQFYAINKSKYSETFDLSSQQLFDLIDDFHINIDPEPAGTVQQIIVIVKVMSRMIRVLFGKRFIFLLTLISFLKLSGLFGIPNLHVLSSKIISSGIRSNVTGEDFLDFATITATPRNCTIYLDVNVYHNFLLLLMNILVAQVIVMLLIDIVGRRIPAFMGFFAFVVASFVMAYVNNEIITAAGSSFLIIGQIIVESVLYVVAIEAFPTAVRGTAVSLTSALSLTASCIIYSYLNLLYQKFLIISGSVMLGISLASYFIPEMKRRPMVE